MFSGPPVSASFALTDHHGRSVTGSDYRGSYMLVYFGFTHCKVVCPRNLKRLSAALERVGERTPPIQALYVTVDPERDTPPVMKAFLERHYPRFIGLTGSVEETEAAQQAFRVFATRSADPDDPDGYAIPHSSLSYLFDLNGAYLRHFADTLSVDAIANSLISIYV